MNILQNKISSVDDWDKHWSQVLTSMHRNPAYKYRNSLIRKILLRYRNQNLRLIDLGCGEGSLARSISNEYANWEVIGVDKVIPESSQKSSLHFKNLVFYKLDLVNDNCDVLLNFKRASIGICSEVLEHLDDPITFLIKSKNFFQSNAELIITVPGGPMSHFDHHLGHRKHYSKKILKSELESAGWNVEKIYRSGFPFHNIYRLITVLIMGQSVALGTSSDNKITSKIKNLIFSFFSILFKFNMSNSYFGWQLIAVAKKITPAQE